MTVFECLKQHKMSPITCAFTCELLFINMISYYFRILLHLQNIVTINFYGLAANGISAQKLTVFHWLKQLVFPLHYLRCELFFNTVWSVIYALCNRVNNKMIFALFQVFIHLRKLNNLTKVYSVAVTFTSLPREKYETWAYAHSSFVNFTIMQNNRRKFCVRIFLPLPLILVISLLTSQDGLKLGMYILRPNG